MRRSACTVVHAHCHCLTATPACLPTPPPSKQVVTPDLKAPGSSRLLHVDLGAGRRRLGGSALAQAYMQVCGWMEEENKRGAEVGVGRCSTTLVSGGCAATPKRAAPLWCQAAVQQRWTKQVSAPIRNARTHSLLLPSAFQVGEASPDVDPTQLKAAFNTTQQLIEEGKLLAGHDISDGGIVTAVRFVRLFWTDVAELSPSCRRITPL